MPRFVIPLLTLWLALPGTVFAETGTVEVDGGQIAGTTEDGVHVFKGVPFAAPPEGELRWKPPQPVESWDGVRECTEFSAICPQAPYPAGSLYARPPEKMSEDCLYLNVWTTSLEASAKRPVMVWIHGGGLTRGSGSHAVYNGANLAKQDVIVVTVNYRLGPFGYLAHPELTRESEHGSSGNYGVLDQIAALEWVQKNIEAFGGDPDRVTIFGESAGSWSVNVLVATPLARGLFHRAIGQSGGSFARGTSLSDAEQDGLAVAEAAEADSLEVLRDLSADELLQAADKADGFDTRTNVDGWVLPQQVFQIFAEGKQNDVPAIVGSNADEMTSLSDPRTLPATVEDFRERVKEEYGERADEYFKIYPADNPAEARQAWLDGRRDRTFSVQMRTWARMSATGESKAYLYYFTHVPPIPNSQYYGAFHAAEIAYVFGNLEKLSRGDYSDDDRKLSQAISSYWVNFAANGDPNGDGLPQWPAYNQDEEPYLEIGTPIKQKNHLLEKQLDFWEKTLQES